jgi:hypothetical protein
VFVVVLAVMSFFAASHKYGRNFKTYEKNNVSGRLQTYDFTSVVLG